MKDTISAGSYYEENCCRNKELEVLVENIDLFDWSFDPPTTSLTDPVGGIQGKQW